ncbi:MAG: MFS transporter [Cyanophyceae cyanobacterium]
MSDHVTVNTASSLRFNLGKLFILQALAFAWFPIPTIILFYQSYGLSLEQALILKTVLSLSTLVCEIPSGYLADLCGRKSSLVAGGAIWTISLLLYCFGGSFSVFLAAEMLAGVAASLISGADTALAFDTLLRQGREGEYPRFEGRMVAIAGVTEAVCGVVGGVVAANNLVYPFYLQAACIALYCLLAATLTEPPRHISQRIKIWPVVRSAFSEPRLKWLIFFSATLSTATFLIVWLSQAYLEGQNFPVASFGLAWALFHGVMSLAAIGATVTTLRLGAQRSFFLLVILLGLSYILLGFIRQPWGIVFIATVYGVRGLKTPLLLSYINRHAMSESRATVLSVNSFVFRLGFAVAGPVAGYLADTYSLDITLMVFGTIFLTLGIFCADKLTFLQVFSD